MARYSIEGLGRLYHVPTIANVSAPTTSELNAGTNLTSFVPRDGFVPNLNQNFVDVSAINDTFDLTQLGTEGGNFTLTFYRDNAVATGDGGTAWNLYVAARITGFLVWREGIASATAWATSQKVMTWPYAAHLPIPVGTASNEGRKFTVGVAIPTVPDRNATVA